MENDTKIKIEKISKYLYSYAFFIAIGLVWNIVDGEIENLRQFIRGAVRAFVMIYLARTIWSLKKVSWWLIAGASCLFSIFGVVGVLFGFVGGIALANTQLLFIGVIVLPATILLVRTFLLVIQKDVKQQFIN